MLLCTANCPHTGRNYLYARQNAGKEIFINLAASVFIFCAIAALKTVMAILQAQNIAPLSCNSLIPICTFPIPGTEISWLGFPKHIANRRFFCSRVGYFKRFPEFVFCPQAVFHGIRNGFMPQDDNLIAIFFGSSCHCIGYHKNPWPCERENIMWFGNIKHNPMLSLNFIEPCIRIVIAGERKFFGFCRYTAMAWIKMRY